MDGEGFPRRSEALAGNVGEADTSRDAMERLGAGQGEPPAGKRAKDVAELRSPHGGLAVKGCLRSLDKVTRKVGGSRRRTSWWRASTRSRWKPERRAGRPLCTGSPTGAIRSATGSKARACCAPASSSETTPGSRSSAAAWRKSRRPSGASRCFKEELGLRPLCHRPGRRGERGDAGQQNVVTANPLGGSSSQRNQRLTGAPSERPETWEQ